MDRYFIIGKEESHYGSIDEFFMSGDFGEHDSITLCLKEGVSCMNMSINYPNMNLHFVGEEFCRPEAQERCDCDETVSTELGLSTNTHLYGYGFVHEGRQFSTEVANLNPNHGLTATGKGKYTFTYDKDCNGCVESITVCSSVASPNFDALTPRLIEMNNKYGKGFVPALFHHASSGTDYPFEISSVNGNKIYVCGFPTGVKCPTRGDSFAILPSSKLDTKPGTAVTFNVNELRFTGLRMRGKADYIITANTLEWRYTTQHSLRHSVMGGNFRMPRHNTLFSSIINHESGDFTAFNTTFLGSCSGFSSVGTSSVSFGSAHVNNASAHSVRGGASASVYLSEFFKCPEASVSTGTGSTTNIKRSRIYESLVGMAGIQAGGFTGTLSNFDRLLGGIEVFLEDCEVGIRIDLTSTNTHEALFFGTTTLTDLILDEVTYADITTYTSGQLGAKQSSLTYSLFAPIV